MKSKITKSIFLIAMVAFFAVGSSGAYLSDTVTVTGNSLTAGTWDVDEQDSINTINNILDVPES